MIIPKLSEELKLEADVTYYFPRRPAPHASSHDDPAYSDPGDDEYVEFDLYMILDKERILINDKFFPALFVQYIYGSMVDDVCAEMRKISNTVYELTA